jgi:CheY-like chemotaxis protein
MKLLHRDRPLVLVVDDEQVVLDEAAAVLVGHGFACRCCTTAEAAITAALLELPDMILADIHLHGENGLEMCQRIKQNFALADVPVMFLSASQTPDIILRSDGVRGTYYLRKPFDQRVLVELIDKALAGSGWVPAHKDECAVGQMS